MTYLAVEISMLYSAQDLPVPSWGGGRDTSLFFPFCIWHSSPLALPKSSESIWLMVRFCSTDISEIMSLDLRRSSMCTDCHRPTGTKTAMSCPGEPSSHSNKGSSSDKPQDALIPGLQH
uniref:Uncharacterized protein n=1 Tax=Meleagris gallopavo TaxID=9103 RepID=A0A803YLG7_MELGA